MNEKDFKYLKNSFLKDEGESYQTLTGNTIIVPAIHRCWSHALIDWLFPIYWILQDIKKLNAHEDFNIFIRRIVHPKHFSIIKDDEYAGNFNTLSKILKPKKILFEDFEKSNFLFEHAFYIDTTKDREFISNYQRSIWNCGENYRFGPGGRPSIKPTFNDDIIYSKLKEFVSFIKKELNIKNYKTQNNLVIIDRSDHRGWSKAQLNSFKSIIGDNFNYNGVVVLEKLDLKSQIEIFSQNNIFISAHGSALINLIFCQKNSTFFDIDPWYPERPIMYSRVAKLTDSTHHYLHDKQDNPLDFIKKELEKIIK